MKGSRIVVAVLDVLLVLLIVVCLMVTVGFRLLGMEMFVVLSGSMNPTLMVDDVIFIKHENDISTVSKGDIITYFDGKAYVTHRVDAVLDNGGVRTLVMKGDNNNAEDEFRVTERSLVGRYLFRLENGGRWYEVLKSPVFLVCVGICVILMVLWGTRQPKMAVLEEDTMDDTGENDTHGVVNR